MKTQLADALRASRADYTDIRFERAWRTAIGFRGSRLEGATTATETGGVVRCLNRGRGWGITGFTRPEDLRAAVARAHELSLAVPLESQLRLAEIPVRDADFGADLDGDVRDIPLAEKRQLLEHLNQEMLGTDRRVVDSWAGYEDAVVERFVATSDGVMLRELQPLVRLTAGAVAREESFVERAVESWAAPAGWHSVVTAEHPFRAAARRAVALLGAPRFRSGTCPVVLDPRAAGALMHLAVGHLSEADRQHREGDPEQVLRPGRRLASELLTMGDDGSASGLAGSRHFDDEGAPTQNTLLVQHGVMVGRLHTRETAARAGVPATGNARADRLREPPAARLTNVYVANGRGSLEELIRGIKYGVYLADAVAGQAWLGRYSLTAGWGQVIRDGQLAELLKPATISGDVVDTLHRLDGVAGDFRWSHLASGCVRGHGARLPVAEGAPHLRFDGLLVGGDTA